MPRSKRRSFPLVFPALAAVASVVQADTAYISNFNNSIWSAPINWDNGVPADFSTADMFKSLNVNYNLTASNASMPTTVQVSGASVGGTATITLTPQYPNPYFKATTLLLGGSVVTTPAGTPGVGPGAFVQLTGTVYLDPTNTGNSINMDAASAYTLGNGLLQSSNQLIGGTFTQSGGANNLSTGATLDVSSTGTYNLAGGALAADAVLNAGTFLINSGSYTNATAAGGTLTNTGIVVATSGVFNGNLINQPGAITTIVGPSPFTGSIADNGRLNLNGASGTFSNPLTGTGTLVLNGGATTITGVDNYLGLTTVVSGTMTLNSSSGPALSGNVTVGTAGTLVEAAPSQLAQSSNVTVNGGTYNLSGFDQTVNALTLAGGQILQSNTTGLGLVTGTVTAVSGSSSISGGLRSLVPYTFNVASSATLAVSGPIAAYDTSPVLAVTLIGGGTLTTSGSNGFANVDVRSGILKLSAGGSFLNVNSVMLLESGGTLSLNNQNQTIGDLYGTGRVALGTGSLTINGQNGGTFAGTIDGSGAVTKTGTDTLVLSGNLAFTGPTNVSAGTLTLAAGTSSTSSAVNVAVNSTLNLAGNLKPTAPLNISGTVNIPANAPGAGFKIVTVGNISFGSTVSTLNVATAPARSDRTLLVTPTPVFAGTTNAWIGRLDLGGNDMVVKNGNLATLINELKTGYANGTWTGQGIVSSAAAADTTHTTGIGIIPNTFDGNTPIFGTGTPAGTFDGYSPATTDILLRYTYVGDTNFDGRIDGSDYSRIDNAAINNLTGWSNGDFNYDGVIDGSDFTLIDNAYNNQGNTLAPIPTALIASPAAAVPEPTLLWVALATTISCTRRRCRLR